MHGVEAAVKAAYLNAGAIALCTTIRESFYRCMMSSTSHLGEIGIPCTCMAHLNILSCAAGMPASLEHAWL